MGTVASPVLIVWTESGAVRSRGSAGPQCSKYYQTLSWKQMCSAASFCVWGIFSRSLDQSSLTTKARVSFFHFLFLRKDNSFLLTFFFSSSFLLVFWQPHVGPALEAGARNCPLQPPFYSTAMASAKCRGSLQVTGWAEGCQLLLTVSSTRVTRKVCKKLRLVFTNNRKFLCSDLMLDQSVTLMKAIEDINTLKLA